MNAFIQVGEDLDHEGGGNHEPLFVLGEDESLHSDDFAFAGFQVVPHDGVVFVRVDFGHDAVDVLANQLVFGVVEYSGDFVVAVAN